MKIIIYQIKLYYTGIHAYTYPYIHIYIYLYVHTLIHIHTHAYTPTEICPTYSHT